MKMFEPMSGIRYRKQWYFFSGHVAFDVRERTDRQTHAIAILRIPSVGEANNTVDGLQMSLVRSVVGSLGKAVVPC